MKKKKFHQFVSRGLKVEDLTIEGFLKYPETHFKELCYFLRNIISVDSTELQTGKYNITGLH